MSTGLTNKKVLKTLHRIWFHYVRLERALNEAHYADVIEYGAGEYDARGPCWAMVELKKRIEDTTAKALVTTTNVEIRGEVRPQ